MMFHCCSSVTAPLDIVGVWTVAGRKDQEPGLQLVHHMWTATERVSLFCSEKQEMKGMYDEFQACVAIILQLLKGYSQQQAVGVSKPRCDM